MDEQVFTLTEEQVNEISHLTSIVNEGEKFRLVDYRGAYVSLVNIISNLKKVE